MSDTLFCPKEVLLMKKPTLLPSKSQLKEDSDDDDSDFDGNEREIFNYTVKKIDQVVDKYRE